MKKHIEAILIAGATAGLSGNTSAQESRPNILFIAVDDWNDMVGAMGYTNAVTPNLDALAARGTVFRNAHTTSTWCAPSRTAIMTGLYPHTSGCYADEPSMYNLPDHPDMAQFFQTNGYTTAVGGKIYHHMQGYLDRRGYDECFIWNESHKLQGWKLNSWGPGAPQPPQSPNSDIAKAANWDAFDFWEMPNELEEEMSDTKCANWAAEFLQRDHEKPFFLAFGTYAPHKENYAPKKYFDLYPLESIVLPEINLNDHDDLPPAIKKTAGNKKRTRFDPIVALTNGWERSIQGYLAAASYADAMIGRVLDSLENSPYKDNTIVVFWSDNGYHLGEKMIWAKHTLWQRTTNIPFIWAGPGVSTNVVSEVTVSLVDTYKTLADLCGFPATHIDGESLVPVFNDPENAADRYIVINYEDSNAVVNQQWRYIKYPDGEELYDLVNDPHEWTNLAANASFVGVKAEMASHLPVNPAPAVTSRSDLKLIFAGEDFYWIDPNNITGDVPESDIAAWYNPGAGAAVDPRAMTSSSSTSRLWAFSETNPLFSGSAALGTKIYGGVCQKITAGSFFPPSGNQTILQIGGGRMVSRSTSDSSGSINTTMGLYIWKKDDFLNSMNDKTLRFDDTAASRLSAYLFRFMGSGNMHWVIRNGETYYLSNKSISSQGVTNILAGTDGAKWASWDPSANNGTEFFNIPTTGFVTQTLNNVTAVGVFYMITNTGNQALFTVETNNGFSAKLVLTPESAYRQWIEEFDTESGTGMLDDANGDGIKNLIEYALGGSPEVEDNRAILPVFSVTAPALPTPEEGQWAEYVYLRRRDHLARGLFYQLETTDNLVSGIWANDGHQETGAGVLDSQFEIVTNRIRIDLKPQQMLRLQIGLMQE